VKIPSRNQRSTFETAETN